MNSYAKFIEKVINQEPENKLLEASALHRRYFGSVPAMTYYKMLERMSRKGSLVHLAKGLYYRPKKSRFGVIPITEKEIIDHYTCDGQGIVIGYRLYNKKGLTTQISKRVEVLSSAVSGQKKNINNICVINSGMLITQDTVSVIETLEILQNYKSIEDISNSALAAYMKEFAPGYSDTAAVFVLKNRKYKKSTIAFLERFLNYFGVKNTLHQFLSALSSYSIPTMEEFYEPART